MRGCRTILGLRFAAQICCIDCILELGCETVVLRNILQAIEDCQKIELDFRCLSFLTLDVNLWMHVAFWFLASQCTIDINFLKLEIKISK